MCALNLCNKKSIAIFPVNAEKKNKRRVIQKFKKIYLIKKNNNLSLHTHINTFIRCMLRIIKIIKI